MSTITFRRTHLYKYVLEEPIEYDVEIALPCMGHGGYAELTESGMLRIARGYRWDGPSGLSFDTPTFMRGSVVHDALYQFMREGNIPTTCRKRADELIRDICLEDGMSRIRASYVYWALRLFGGSSAKPKVAYPVVTAP